MDILAKTWCFKTVGSQSDATRVVLTCVWFFSLCCFFCALETMATRLMCEKCHQSLKQDIRMRSKLMRYTFERARKGF